MHAAPFKQYEKHAFTAYKKCSKSLTAYLMKVKAVPSFSRLCPYSRLPKSLQWEIKLNYLIKKNPVPILQSFEKWSISPCKIHPSSSFNWEIWAKQVTDILKCNVQFHHNSAKMQRNPTSFARLHVMLSSTYSVFRQVNPGNWVTTSLCQGSHQTCFPNSRGTLQQQRFAQLHCS